MIIIPFYVMMRSLGLANTHLGLVLAYTAFCLPFALWMLRTFFQSIPLEIEEAALTDGASRAQAVIHVVLPLALPGVIATGIFTFILAWNDYIFARVLLSADELKTLPVGHRRPLQRLGGRLGHDHGGRHAGDRAGARGVPLRAALPRRRLGRGRRQGLGARWPSLLRGVTKRFEGEARDAVSHG